MFDGVLASDRGCNLTGKLKAERLVQRFREGGFDYCGNEHRDIHYRYSPTIPRTPR
jgi:hypothetical protein